MLAESLPTAFEFISNIGLLLVLVTLSGSFSGSEAVLFSLSPTRVQESERSNQWLERLVAWAMRRPDKTLMDILIANTALNVLLFSISYVFFKRLEVLGPWVTPASAIFSILLVIVFGEVVPKIVGVALADRLAPFSALLVRVASYPAAPLGWVTRNLIVEPIDRLFLGGSGSRREQAHELTGDELKFLLEMNRERGLLNRDENLILREVVNLAQIRVRDVMVPRVDLVSFDIHKPVEELVALIRSTKLRKVPVCDGGIDQLVGIIYAKRLFLERDKPLRDLVSPVAYVPESISGEQVLHHFRETRSQLAIAVDEYGGVAGLVTLEDVLEEIVGEIHDPDDETAMTEVVALSDGGFEVAGRLSIHYWGETFGIQELPQRVATVGGLVADYLGRPARVGDVVHISNVRLEVLEIQNRQAARLSVRVDAEAGGTRVASKQRGDEGGAHDRGGDHG